MPSLLIPGSASCRRAGRRCQRGCPPHRRAPSCPSRPPSRSPGCWAQEVGAHADVQVVVVRQVTLDVELVVAQSVARSRWSRGPGSIPRRRSGRRSRRGSCLPSLPGRWESRRGWRGRSDRPRRCRWCRPAQVPLPQVKVPPALSMERPVNPSPPPPTRRVPASRLTAPLAAISRLAVFIDPVALIFRLAPPATLVTPTPEIPPPPVRLNVPAET